MFVGSRRVGFGGLNLVVLYAVVVVEVCMWLDSSFYIGLNWINCICELLEDRGCRIVEVVIREIYMKGMEVGVG